MRGGLRANEYVGRVDEYSEESVTWKERRTLHTFCAIMIINQTVMAKYSKGAQDKVEKVMHERKKGTLRSGSGKKVTSRKQAIAIGLSEARKQGSKVPKKK